MTKRKKRIILMTGVTLCIMAVIVASVSMYVYIKGKKAPTDKVSYKEIAANTTLPTKQYDNIDLSNTVLNVPQHGEFYQYYILGNDNKRYTKEETAKIARDIFPKAFDLDSDKLVFGSEEGEPWDDDDESWDDVFSDRYFNVTYSDTEYINDGKYIEKSGAVDIYQDTHFDLLYDWRHMINATIKEMVLRVDLGKGQQLPDEAYEMFDGKQLKMQDALEMANRSLERIKEYIPPEIEVRPANFYVLRCEFVPKTVDSEGNIIESEPIEHYQYQIYYEYLLDGIPLTDSVPYKFDFTQSLPRVGAERLDIEIYSSDRINRIHQHNSCAVDGFEEQPLEDEFLTLESACDILSDFLAPEYTQYINEITVKYALTWDSTVDNTGKKLYLRPYWCFLKDDMYDNIYAEGGEKQLLVDMQTGDIFATVGDVYVSTIKTQNDKTLFMQQSEGEE